MLHVSCGIKHAVSQHRHFHPSGDATLSKEDIGITKRLLEAGKLLGIELADHIIMGDNNYVSMKKRIYISFL